MGERYSCCDSEASEACGVWEGGGEGGGEGWQAETVAGSGQGREDGG